MQGRSTNVDSRTPGVLSWPGPSFQVCSSLPLSEIVRDCPSASKYQRPREDCRAGLLHREAELLLFEPFDKRLVQLAAAG